MVARYQNSVKPAHRRFIRIELQVENFEQEQNPVMPTRRVTSHALTPSGAAKAKVMPKRAIQPPPTHPVPVEMHQEIEDDEEWSPTLPYHTDPDLVHAMQQRLLNMEDAMMRVMRHLENQSAEQNAKSQTQHE